MPYPEGKIFDEGFLQVSDIHKIYYMQCGKPDGKPVVFLHGGPGGDVKPSDAVYFNPDIYRVILFDQRGAGKSEPTADLRDNTTWDSVADIEKLREKFGIDKWIVFGGSWGSTLSLAYAQTHPDRAKALILRGIFLLRRSELQFFYQDGTSHIWPEQYDAYSSFIPEDERHDLMTAYYSRLTSDDEEVSLAAAQRWSTWENSTNRIIPDKDDITKASDDIRWTRAFARIENHYFVNKGFFPEDGFLIKASQIAKIRHIPCVVVQGRYDLVCPAKSAYDLKKVWGDDLILHVADQSGHSAQEPQIKQLLVEAADKFASL